MFDGEAYNPLDILSYVCSNYCSKLNVPAPKHPLATKKHNKPPKFTLRPDPNDYREALLFCYETLEDSSDEDDDYYDARKMIYKESRNYHIERTCYKFASRSPPLTRGFLPPKTTIITTTTENHHNSTTNNNNNVFKVPHIPRDRKRKAPLVDTIQCQTIEDPPRKLTRQNRGNLYKQIMHVDAIEYQKVR